MPNWVQLKDGVAFAYVNSSAHVENSIMLDDSINPESILAKKYENNEWVDAPLIHFVEEMLGNKVLRVNSTVYASDVKGEICGPEVREMWRKDESGQFIPPANIGEATIYDEHLFE